MQIQGPAHVHGPQPVNAPHRAQSTQPSDQATATQAADQLDISREADFVSRARDIPDIRADRVNQIRAAIEAGEYETPEKLEVAVERLFAEIG